MGFIRTHQAIKATPSLAYFRGQGGSACVDSTFGDGIDRTLNSCERGRPAVVRTPIYKALIPKDEVDITLTSLVSFHPIGWGGTPNEVAPTLEFLLEKAALGSPTRFGILMDALWQVATANPHTDDRRSITPA